MPRKPKSLTQSQSSQSPMQPYHLPNDAPWGGFVNIRLSDEQKDSFHLWLEANSAHYPADFDDMLNSGCKISFAYDAQHQAYVVSTMGALMLADPNKRFASTSRAGTLNEAIALTVWKHLELCRGDYGNYKPSDGSFMSWG